MVIGFATPASSATTPEPALAAPTPPFQVKSFGQGPGGTPLVTSGLPTGLAPATIGAVYNLHTGLLTPSSADGAGQVIAVIDAYHDPNALSDLNAFNAEYGYPILGTCSSGPPFTTTTGACFYQADPQGTPIRKSSWILEESLDLEWAHAEAPGATIVLVEAANNSPADLFGAVGWANDNGATEVSMSWSTNEASDETSYDSYFDATSTSTGAPILYTAAAGDDGHAVGYPAASPNVIGVGGTTLNGCSDTSCAEFTSESAWSDSGGGISAYEKIPPYQSAFSGAVYGESSGEISALTGGMRGVPDVSFDANTNTGVSVYDSTTYESQSGWFTVGGTSVGAPNWAGILAVGEGGAGPLQGAQKIYGGGYESFLRDITGGTNGSCGTDCTAATGYDLVTGLGSAMNYPPPAAPPVQAYPGTSGSPVAGFGEYPNWLPVNTGTGAGTMSNLDHSEGSDTTLFVMQQISDLYSQAGILPFSCAIYTTGGANGTCETPAQNSGVNPNNTQSDETDNYAGSEELQGINDVGSGNGLNELCSAGSPNPPAGTTVDYARASRPDYSSTCPGDQGIGFAKDAVIPVDFPAINPGLYGTATGYEGQTDPQCSGSGAGYYPSYAASDGTLVCTKFASGDANIGPVADGWLPTDPTNCGTTGPACSGTPFTDMDNTAIGGGTGATSVAYRLFCMHGSSASPNTSQIMDWGQLTNLSGSEVPGQGAPIGVPIRIIAINNGSGTVATFYNFAQSGIGSPAVSADCGGGSGTVSSKDVDVNAASGPDPVSNATPGGSATGGQGPAGTSFTQNTEDSLENDANQIGDFANANWPSDAADQAVDIATSLYSMSYGAYASNPNAEVTSIETAVPAGDPSTFTAKFLEENLKKVSTANERANVYPTSRTLFNYILPTTVRASVGGFINWMCDSNSAIQKGTDHIDGGNFDTDLTNTIDAYGYSRLTDATLELPESSQTTADNIPQGGVNGSCDAQLGISSIAGDDKTITLSAPAPTGVSGTGNAGQQIVQAGWTVNIPSGYSLALPAGGDTVASVSGSTIVLSSPLVAGTGGTAPTTLYFPGHAPIMSVGTVGS